ncbi:wound induced protein [Hordeum vulgare]|uniref:Predicted protein n=1 Tax=Hordeum vulgare subsp. vulgare TaxID=112509 RepID=F2EK61_HORVV|nr:uncharacterized protein LOC123403149 [Hordeum vulgare subsp. vulgare]KAE8801208.1 wound induced protein [Hordeum vulgare]KAI4977749.1 hypothetical protein ZWY2020_014303 [Hordeum vulgare]BAK07733.1 predicted protein [Hordeum vulgare subsp. vulgare]
MASAASRKAPSLVVAASVGAVEALKDQAGLCRWGYPLRSLYRHAAAAPRVRALSASLSEAAAAATAPRPASLSAEDTKLRKAHHLVCWGPN